MDTGDSPALTRDSFERAKLDYHMKHLNKPRLGPFTNEAIIVSGFVSLALQIRDLESQNVL